MSGTSVVRFHGELRDLTARGRRDVPVPVAFDVPPSVKDVVESLGVPHTEVGFLVVDGRLVGFDHRLAEGAVIDVHPVSAAEDVPVVLRLQPAPHPVARFVADVHLAALARHLRLLGFDTLLATSGEDDAAIAATAAAEQRIVLTRDRGLLKRRIVTHGVLVRHDDPREQVVEVVRRLGLADELRPFTRCLACNDVPVPVEAAVVHDELQSGTRRNHQEFRRCPGCRRIYWRGSHHARLAALVDEVRRRACGGEPGGPVA